MDYVEDSEPYDSSICSACIEEPFLVSQFEENGRTSKCEYCGTDGVITVPLGWIADETHKALERHFYQTSENPSESEWYLVKEGNWERHGEDITGIIGDILLTDPKIADDVRQILQDTHYDRGLAEMGDESPYCEDSQYDYLDTTDGIYGSQWREFKRSIATHSRFFNKNAQDILNSMFEGLNDAKTTDGDPAIVSIGPAHSIDHIFRARVAQSNEDVKKILSSPVSELGPPPASIARAGRMNARGISVLYGATSSDIAIAEVRPPVGADVIVGRFDMVKEMNLLDVTAFQSLHPVGSYFDPGYKARLEQAKFLESLVYWISRPVMPEDEDVDYLATQVIAEYLLNVHQPALDGILYPSTQDGQQGGRNVVLFHHASSVESISYPEGTSIDVQTGYQTEDGWEVGYTIWIEEPQQSDPEETKITTSPYPDFTLGAEGSDIPEPYVRLVPDSIFVCKVEAISYIKEEYPVNQHRTEKSAGRDMPF